jgi:hypothetical protein
MENLPEQALPELVRQVQAHLRDGKPEAARTLLIQYVRKNPQLELGWDLLSQVVTSPREQADCLHQVLKLNPHNQEAQMRLQRILAQAPSPTAAPPKPSASETPKTPSELSATTVVVAPQSEPVATEAPKPTPSMAPAEPTTSKTPEPAASTAPASSEPLEPAPSAAPAEPVAGESPEPTPSVAQAEPAATDESPTLISPLRASPGEESPRLGDEPAATETAPALPLPLKTRPKSELSCFWILAAVILVVVIVSGVFAAVTLLPAWLNLAQPRLTPPSSLSPTLNPASLITPTPFIFPTLAPTAPPTLSPTPQASRTPSLAPAFTASPLPSEPPTEAETPAPVGPVSFGTPVPGLVATFSADSVVNLTQVALWKLSDPSLVFTSLAVAPNGRTIAAGVNDGSIRLWRAADGGDERLLAGHTQPVSGLAFSADGELLISGAGDKTLRLWRVSDGSLVRTFTGHTAEVNSVAFAPNGLSVASGSLDNTTQIWDVNTGNLRYQVKGKVAGVAYSPDAQMLAIAGGDKIRLVRAGNGAAWLNLKSASAQEERLAFAPDGKTLASSSAETPAQLWRISDGSPARAFEAPAPVSPTVRLSDNVSFSPDGQLLASGTADGFILVWRVSDGALRARVPTGASEVIQVVFGPDAKALFSLSVDGAVGVWTTP